MSQKGKKEFEGSKFSVNEKSHWKEKRNPLQMMKMMFYQRRNSQCFSTRRKMANGNLS
jgi:hypothetical protein